MIHQTAPMRAEGLDQPANMYLASNACVSLLKAMASL